MPRFLLSLLLCPVLLTACPAPTPPSPPPPAGTTVTVVEMDGTSWTYQASSFTPAPAAPSENTAEERALMDLVNRARQAGGECQDGPQVRRFPPRAPLTFETHLNAAAHAYARTLMTRTLNLNAEEDPHLNPADPAGRTPAMRMVRASFTPVPTSAQSVEFLESLAFGQMTPAEALNAWQQQSPAHCLALYSAAAHAGLAVQDGPPGAQFTRYWVLNVGGIIPR